MKRLFIALILLTGILSCKKSVPHRELTWTGYTYYILPPKFNLDSVPPHIFSTLFHMGHYIHISDTGESLLIIRKGGDDAQREVYSIQVSDSLKEVLFNLASDSTVFKYTEEPKSDGMLYCGYAYMLSCKKDTMLYGVGYIPPYANPQLYRLHELFDQLRKEPRIIKAVIIDTTVLDRALYKQVLRFNPFPPPEPIRSDVKFTPPEIKPDEE